MDAGYRRKVPPGISLLAGLEAGIVGVLVMLAWLAVASAWYRRSVWITINLMATLFYGDAAIQSRLTWKSLSGLAAYLVLYGGLGALVGVAAGGHTSRRRMALIGIAAGLAWYYFSFGFLWKRVAPLLVLYTHDSPMLAGHILYGYLLGRISIYARRLWRQPPPLTAASPQPAEPAQSTGPVNP